MADALKNSDAHYFLNRIGHRCLKTLRRLFHPLPAEVWSMLKTPTPIFNFFQFTNIFFCLRSAENVSYYHRFRRQKIADALVSARVFFILSSIYDANSIPHPGRDVADAYLQQRQISE